MNELLWEYEVFRERCYLEDVGDYYTYGIRLAARHMPPDMQSGYTIHDVHCERDVVTELVTLCNTLELEPCHLLNVIEDWLARGEHPVIP